MKRRRKAQGGVAQYWFGCGLRKCRESGRLCLPLDAVKSTAHAKLISRPPARYLQSFLIHKNGYMI